MTIAFGFTGNVPDAEDIVQETYVAIFEKEYYDNPKGAGITMVKNKSINWYRRKVKRNYSPKETPDYASPYNDVDRFISSEQIARIEEILEPCRFDLLYLFAKGFQYEEISKLFRIPMGTVKSWMHLARKELVKAKENNYL